MHYYVCIRYFISKNNYCLHYISLETKASCKRRQYNPSSKFIWFENHRYLALNVKTSCIDALCIKHRERLHSVTNDLKLGLWVVSRIPKSFWMLSTEGAQLSTKCSYNTACYNSLNVAHGIWFNESECISRIFTPWAVIIVSLLTTA